MRTRPHLSLLVIAALLASALGSIAAVATSTGTADACSIAGPHAEAWPSVDLKPGQRVEIVGWGFHNIQWSEQQPQLVPAVDDSDRDLPELCDFDLSPMANLDMYWRGNTTDWLGMVSGPDFKTTIVVPNDALPGPASITVGSIEVAVFVGNVIEPPPPCPLTLQPDGTAHHVCPEPWPCPLYAGSGSATSGGTQPAPDADHAPGYLPPCPEPCVDAAHTIDDGTVYDYRWDCPDPCGLIQAGPGAAPQDQAIWCPPPDPCPVYLAGEPVDAEAALVSCPDPCPMYSADAVAGQPDQAIWCPPPDPCPVYLAGEPVDADAALVSCPDPCGVVGTDGVWCPPPDPCPLPALSASADPSESESLPWCPPGPCHLVGGDVLVCPESETATSESASAPSAEANHGSPAPAPEAVISVAAPTSAPASPAPPEPAPVTAPAPDVPAAVRATEPTGATEPRMPHDDVRTDTSRATADIVARMSQRMARVAGAIVASILG